MNSILHLSDFHIDASMPKPSDNKVFCSMIEKVKEEKLENLIIVYTGDVIDSKSIIISKSKDIRQSKEEWESQASKAFSLAKEYFQYLTAELGVDNKHIILAVGNHDVNLYGIEQLSFKCPSKKGVDETIRYGKERFKVFSTFLKELNYQFADVENHMRTIDGFNFIVANTQWVNKGNLRTQGMCYNCNSLYKVLKENESTLLNTKESLKKINNIFIAHNPDRDFCEDACYDYPNNDYQSIAKEVVSYCGIKLFGDKHTERSDNYDYIVGAPLKSDIIYYGIHIFADNGSYKHKLLAYEKGKWFIKEESESVKEILSCSYDCISNRAYEFLDIEHDYMDLVVNKICEFNTIQMSDGWKYLDEMFSSIVKIQLPVKEMPGIPIDLSDGIFKRVTEIIQQSKSETCLTIRGSAGLGKSIFLSSLYLNLLYEFSSDQFSYIPVYIDIEKIINKCIDDSTKNSKEVVKGFCIDNNVFLTQIREIIEKKFKNIEKLCADYNCKVCIIVDGIKQFKYYDSFYIEDDINSLLTEYYRRDILQSTVICIDTDNKLSLEYSIFHQKRNSEYIAYFDSVLSYNVESQEKLKHFVKSYCMLKNYKGNAVQNVFDNIQRLHIPWIDLRLFFIAERVLVNQSNNPDPIFNTIFEKYLRYVFAGKNEHEKSLPARVSYLLYYKKCNYTAIKKREKNLSYNLFNSICRDELLSKMLIAINYCNTILRITSKRNSHKTKINDIDRDVINRLYGDELCKFIVGYLQFNNSGERLKNFEKSYYGLLDYSGRSTLTYLIGRIVDKKTDLEKILDTEERILNEEEIQNNVKDISYYRYRVAKRSITISRLANGMGGFLDSNGYFEKLLSDDYERRINRKFFMQFYGDRNEFQIEPQHDVILNGLDFYNTYQKLATRLLKWTQRGKKGKLLELELFTLCDLVQIHLDNPLVTHKFENGKMFAFEKNDNRTESFFYNERYTDRKRNKALPVLKLIIETIDMYNRIYGSGSKMRKYKQYLHVRRDQFVDAMVSIENNMPVKTFSINSLLDELSGLSNIKKTGWYIEDSSIQISDDKMSKILNRTECYETTLEHVYECFLIGLLYLPNKIWSEEKYDKDTVLKMLLIHDMGEAYIGDYPPSYVNYLDTRSAEHRHCIRVFLSGLHEDVANLTEYWNLWNDWYAKDRYGYDSNINTSINIRIAMEIDKIQMIYKMFKLLLQGKISLPKQRVLDFYKAKDSIHTLAGISIFNKLIANNKEFFKIGEDYDIMIREIETRY